MWCVVLVLVADRIIKLLEFYINHKVCIVFSDTAVLALIIVYSDLGISAPTLNDPEFIILK